MIIARRSQSRLLLLPLLVLAGLAASRDFDGGQPSAQGSSLGKIFDTALADFTSQGATKLKDAISNAPSSRPKECRSDKPKFRIISEPPGPSLSPETAKTVEAARRNAITDYLRGQGIADDAYSIEFVAGPAADDGKATVTHERTPDETPPTLTIEPERKQVSRNEAVRFLLKASDEATGWDTGVKSIELRNKSAGDESVGFMSWGHIANPCNASTKRRELPVAYTVPRNPPLLIVFQGEAADYAGKYRRAAAVLTTGEFSGRYEWTYESETVTGAAAGDKETQIGVADFSLKRSDETNLTGEMFGLVRHAFGGPCPPRSLSEGYFRADIAAQYVTGRLSIPDNPHPEVIRYPRVRLCNDYNDEVDWVHTNYLGYLYEAFQRLQPHDDLGQRAHRPPTPQRTNTGVHSATYTLTIQRHQK